MKVNKSFKLSKAGLLSLCIVAASAAMAQEEELEEEVYVTGYRGALMNSIDAKRNSMGFRDEVFADDMGKMPSQNLAESLARIPGVKISREVTGEGQQIAVRGLGPAFTKVVLNGNSIDVASIGNINSNGSGREVDLDVFPTELFSSLAVDKTLTARQLEGGTTGYINMRTMRPSDQGEGHHVRYSYETNYRASNGSYSPKGVFTYSFSNDKVGALVTVVGSKMNRNVDGYETVGNVSQTGCLITDVADSVDCRGGESATFRFTDIASFDYAEAYAGVEQGDTLDIYETSGMSQEELYAVGMPYIGRVMTMQGQKDTLSALFSFELTPTEDLGFALDVIDTSINSDYVRTEVMHIYRRNYQTAYIPVDVTATDNGNGPRLNTGTFYGNRPWVGSRDYKDDVSITSVMPSMDWRISDTWNLSASASQTASSLVRDNPYGLFYTAEGTMSYANDGDVPTVNHSEFDNYEDYQWQSLRTGHIERQTETQGFHAELEWGEEASVNGVIFGVSYDEMESSRQNFGVGQGSLEDYLAANGMEYVTENLGDYIAPVTLGASIDDYNGYTSVGDLQWDRFKAAIGYDGIGLVPTSTTLINEAVIAYFVEGNIEFNIAGRPLRGNLGVRYVDTDQHVATKTGETNESYTKTLPSLSAVYDATDDIKVRFSASQSLSRANPEFMYPNSQWASSGIDAINAGNPFLEPFESDNLDLGGEWYFSDLGYVGLTYFKKEVTGFVELENVQVNFNDLGDWGMDTSDLSDTQEDELSICDPNCMVSVRTRVNIEGTTDIDGWEAIWVQPLDMLVKGMGFNASYTTIDAVNESGEEISGVADSYNVTGFYENEAFQVRLTYYHQDGSHEFDSWGAPVTGRDRAQVDFAASYNLPFLTDHNLSLTFDAYNLTNEPLSSNAEEDDSQTFNAYYPGSVYTFGIRGSF